MGISHQDLLALAQELRDLGASKFTCGSFSVEFFPRPLAAQLRNQSQEVTPRESVDLERAAAEDKAKKKQEAIYGSLASAL